MAEQHHNNQSEPQHSLHSHQNHQNQQNITTPHREITHREDSPTHHTHINQALSNPQQNHINNTPPHTNNNTHQYKNMDEEDPLFNKIDVIDGPGINSMIEESDQKPEGAQISLMKKALSEMPTVQKGEGNKKRRGQGNFARYQDQDVPKKRKNQQQHNSNKLGSQHIFKSKRKIRPQMSSVNAGCYNPEERLAMIENNFRQCHIGNKKTTKKTSSNNFSYLTSWIQHQFFYSNYERPYFQQNDFRQLIETLHMKGNEAIKYKDFKQIQRCMGKPKLFSATFFHEERLGVEDTRQIARQYSKTQNINILNERLLNSNSNAYYQRVCQLKVGTPVLALASCGHLHIGTVLGEHKQNTLVVKFCTLELGIQKIQDSLISSEYSICKQPDLRQNSQIIHQSKTNDLVQSVDYFSVALFFRSLLLKSNLIGILKELNQQTLKFQQFGEPIPQQHRINTLMVIQHLEGMIQFMKPVLANFRLRGVSSYHREQIAKSFKKLLISPLNFMQKQLQSNVQQADQSAIRQIGQILQVQQQNKVQQLTKTLCQNSKCEESVYSSEEGTLVKNCLAILIGMKMQNRPCQLVQNKYMKNISQIIYNHFGEQLNQINECISAICSK